MELEQYERQRSRILWIIGIGFGIIWGLSPAMQLPVGVEEGGIDMSTPTVAPLFEGDIVCRYQPDPNIQPSYKVIWPDGRTTFGALDQSALSTTQAVPACLP